ncbi:unnamed protein product [Peniophora sp. CBMAI 1063]|nr:unnamed protein product [Peniophora sp. CBMAI 1063]
MSVSAPPILRFDKLPAELISSIIYFAQIAWHNEHFAAQAPFAGVKRYQVSGSASAPPSIPQCCNGIRWDSSRPICIRSDSGKALPPHLPSPAHSASLVSRKLRDALIDESRIWKLDNTLYPAIAKLSGEHRTTSSGRQVIQYGSRSLIALDVCTCFLLSVRAFYSSLERVKLRLPWSGDGTLGSELQQFLRDTRGGADGHLRHVDVEALDADPLHIAQGLRPCSRTLEFLTIDIAAGFVAEVQGSVTFPRLRYFRLCTHRMCGAALLRWMVLPYALDLHLEPVVYWRKSFTARHPTIYEVPFWPSRYAPEERFEGEWRWIQKFAKTLDQPHRTAAIHSATPDHHVAFGDPADILSRRSATVVGLDVRIDPSTKPHEPAAAKFPELVSLTLAESAAELRPVLHDPVGRDWERSQELQGKIAARRSLTFRDGQFSAYDRARDFNSQYPKALYDTLYYVIHAPVSWAVAAQELVFAKDSWLPDRSLGYQHILQCFNSIRALHVDSPALPPDVQFTQNMEGCFTADHLQALALSLNIPTSAGNYVCLALEHIHLRVPEETLKGWIAPIDWDGMLNSPGRLASRARKIRLSTFSG